MGAGGGEELLQTIRVRAIAEGQQAIATLQQSLKSLDTTTGALAQSQKAGAAAAKEHASALAAEAPVVGPLRDEMGRYMATTTGLGAAQKAGAAAAREHAGAQHEAGDALKHAHQFVPDLTDRIKTMTAAGHGASFGFRMIKSATAEMALEAVGAKGPLAHLAEGLIVFSAGSGPMIAIAGGITIIALLFEKLSGSAEGAAQRLKEASKAGEEAAKKSLDPRGVQRAQVGALQTADRETMGRLASLRQDLPLARKAAAANSFDEEAQADLSRIESLVERYEQKHLQNLHEQHALIFADFEVAKRELEVKLQAAGKDAEEAAFLDLRAKYGNDNAARSQLDLENRTTYLALTAELNRQTRAIAETDLARYAESLKASKTLTGARIADLVTQRQALTYAEQLHKAQEALTDAAGTALDRRTRELAILGLERDQINDILALEARRQAVADLGTLRGTLSDTSRPRVVAEGAQKRIEEIVGALTDAGLNPETGKRTPMTREAAQRGLQTRGTALQEIAAGLDEAIKHIKENAKKQEEAGKQVTSSDNAKVQASLRANQALDRLSSEVVLTATAFRELAAGKLSALGPALTGLAGVVEQVSKLKAALAAGGSLGPLGAGLALGGTVFGLIGGLFGHKSQPMPVHVATIDPNAAASIQSPPEPAPVFVVQLIGSDGKEIVDLAQVELARRQQRDRVVRLPATLILPGVTSGR